MNRRTFLKTSALLGGGSLAPLATCGLSSEAGRKTTEPKLSEIEASERFERLHRQLTVADSYSACVELDDLERAGTDVVFQAMESEELLVRLPPKSSSQPPPAGLDTWENVFKGDDVVRRVTESIRAQLKAIDAEPNRIALARDSSEIESVVQSGRIALVLMLKSGWISDRLEVLRNYHNLGVRVMALCHLAAFSWSDSTAERNRIPGLSAFGREVVSECNRLGLLVDLSHASDETARHALEVSKRPLIATHSNCRALSGSYRDLNDDTIRAIAKNGGVISVLAAASRTSKERHIARLRRDRRLAKKYSDPFELASAKRRDAIVWGTKLNLAHIDHVVRLVGIEHVGVASHCTSVPQWREFTEVLVRHGYRQDDVKKILGLNVLRVFKEAVAK